MTYYNTCRRTKTTCNLKRSEVSNALQIKRLDVGLTQAQIAKKVGVSERGYRKYETSATAKTKSIPDVLTALKIADALGVENLRELWNYKKE